MNEMKRPISSMNLYNNLDKRNILLNKIYKKEYNLKELNNDFKEKKLIMLESMDEEINKSISKNFMKKYNSITYFDNSYNVYVPEDKKESFQKITDEYIQNMEENADSLIYHSVRLLFFKHKKHFLNVLLDREELEDGEFILTDRTVTTQYSGTFLDRLFWVKYNDDSRTIYLNN